MTSAEPTRVYCLLSDDNGKRVLLFGQVPALTPPVLQFSGHFVMSDQVGTISARLRSEYGLPAHVVRHLATEGAEQFCEIEWLPGEAPQHKGEWFDAQTIAASPQGQIIGDWLASKALPPPPDRAPWEQSGWLEQAMAWIDNHAERTGPVTPIKGAWGLSAVLRVPAASGDLYFKACNAMPPGEIAITQALAERWPQHVLQLVAVDQQRNWMLSQDMNASALAERPTADWAEAVRIFAQIQTGAAGEIDHFRQLGCPALRPQDMASLLETLLNDQLIGDAGLTELERSQWQRDLPQWHALWNELADAGLPLTLHFQDFHNANLAFTDDTVCIFDWCDTVISHPFLSIQRFVDDAHAPPGILRWDGDFDRPADSMRREIRDTYLAVWADYAPMPKLLKAFSTSRPLHECYQAIRHYRQMAYVEAGSPVHTELLRNVMQALRVALAIMEDRRRPPFSSQFTP